MTSTPYNIPPLLMHPRNYEDYPDEPDNWPYILRSVKLNGVRGILNPHSGKIFSKHKREFVPLAELFLVPTRDKFGANCWLDGEILWPGHTLQDIAGLLGQNDPAEEDLKQLQFHVFDMTDLGTFVQRKALLTAFFAGWEDAVKNYLQLVPTKVVDVISHPSDYDWSHAAPDLEGYIYRNPNGKYEPGSSYNVLKHKRLRDAEYRCLSVKEGKGKFKGMFGGATLQLNEQGHTFDCGGGFLTVENRRQLWLHPPIGKLVTVRYPYTSDDGVPLQGQFVSVRDYE